MIEIFFIIVINDIPEQSGFPIAHNLEETIFNNLEDAQKALEKLQTEFPKYGTVFATINRTNVSMLFWLNSSLYDYCDVLEEICWENYEEISSKQIWF